VAGLEEASRLGVRHVLFICSRNQLRSPTAEKVFSVWPGIEVASAGFDPAADEPVHAGAASAGGLDFRHGKKASEEAVGEISGASESSARHLPRYSG
jgi:protein-tyrosine-phosphatase